jgi:hypothetical protein
MDLIEQQHSTRGMSWYCIIQYVRASALFGFVHLNLGHRQEPSVVSVPCVRPQSGQR